MLTEQDRETLIDGVHMIISELPKPKGSFGVEWIARRLANRANVAVQIALHGEAASIIEKTMNDMTENKIAFPDLRPAEPDATGGSRWTFATQD